MKIAVMGAGSVGGFLGGMLARAGHRVTLVARGPRLEAIRASGLTVLTPESTFTLRCPEDVEATGNPADVGPVDLLLWTVKTYHNRDAVAGAVPMVGSDTVVLPLQNGVDSYLPLSLAFGEKIVLPAVIYVEASTPGPASVRQSGDVVRVVFGEPDGSDSARGRALSESLNAANVPSEFILDVTKALWCKLLFIATMAGVTSASRLTMAQLMPLPRWREVVTGCLREIEAVARSSGVDLDPGIVPDTLSYIQGSLEDLSASMHADIMAGRPLELEALNGAVVRAGEAAGVPTPINDLLYALLKPYELGAPPPL